MVRCVVLISLLTFLAFQVQAQDSLPKIKVIHRGGKVIVSWINPFTDIVQINIQRSYDSMTGFKTIHSIADPKAVTNGFLDGKPPGLNQFYRVYVQQTGGKYFFSPSSRPRPDAPPATAKNAERKTTPRSTPQPGGDNPAPAGPGSTARTVEGKTNPQSNGPTPEPSGENPVASEERDISQNRIQKNSNSRRKLAAGQAIESDRKVDIPDEREFRAPSIFVYTNPQGHVVIALPPEKVHLYTLKFFREDGSPLFAMNKIREPFLTIDKTNFMRWGWFRFELYENNVLKEKNRLFIPRENL